MFRIIRTAALSAIIGLGALAAMPASAEASSLSIGIGSSSAGVSFHFGSRAPAHRHVAPRYRHAPACTNSQALSKASRMGLRGARIVHSSRNQVQVRGWSRHRGQSSIMFARAPHCPIVARY